MTSKNEKLRFDMKSELLNLDGRLHITSFGLIYSRRYILNFSLIKKTIQAGLFVLLIFFFNNNVKYYDQCAVGDTNLVALSVRTLTNRIGDFDKGNVGLSSRIPVKLNSYPTPGFNILFIIGESLRSQNMQVYGYHRPTTPFLAELVDSRNNEFFVARRAFTNASTTVVSLPSVFSGIAPYQPSDLLYRTPLFWDYVKSCGYSNFFISSHDHEWFRLSNFFAGSPDYYWNKKVSGLNRYNDIGIDDRKTTDEFFRYTRELLSAGKPFAGVLHYNTNHLPYNHPAEFVRWSGESVDNYDNSILYQDDLYRQVFQFLANNGALENTVVIIAADHGQAFREHGYIGHLDCNYIETVSVPMMFFIPKEVQKNFKMDVFKRNLAENHALVDIIPTLLTLLGIDNEPDIKSYSIKFAGRSLFENDSTNRDIIICNSHEISESNVGLSLVRQNMHYIFRTNITPPQEELYNIDADPWEHNNLWQNLDDSAKSTFHSPFEQFVSTANIISKRK